MRPYEDSAHPVSVSAVSVVRRSKVATAPSTALESAPRASVIIVNYNGREYLEECLRSLLNKDRWDYEVILVDNASTDGSVEYV